MAVHRVSYDPVPAFDCDEIEASTTREKGEEKEKNWSQILAASSAVLCLLPAGISTGFSAILIPQLEAPDSDLKLDKDGYSSIASAMAFTIPFGDVLAGLVADKFGRITTMRIAVVPFIVGWACIALATNLPLMIVGRICTGLFQAMTGGPCFAFISEVITPKTRGTIMSLGVVFYFSGVMMVYLVGAFLYWRTIAWLAAASCVLPHILLKLLATESPPWLVSKSRDEEARKSLEFLMRWSKKPGSVERHMEIMIENQKKTRKSHKKSVIIRTLKGLAKPTGYKPLAVVMGMCVFHEFSGTYVIVYYTVSLFQGLGATLDPYVCTVGVGAITLFMCILSTTSMRFFGRRTLLLFSAVGMAVTMFLAGFLKMQIENGSMAPNIGPAVCVLLYTIFNRCGFLNIPWMLPSELFPIEIRGLLDGCIYAFSNLLMSVIIKIYPYLPEQMGGLHNVLWLFAGFSLGAGIFVFIFLPETHGRTIFEIQEYFQHNFIYICRKKVQDKIKTKNSKKNIEEPTESSAVA